MVALDEQGLIQKNKPSVENIRKWRKTILQLYALSRFQYPICIGTLPIKRFRTCANAIKAVQRFKEAGIKDGTDSLLGDYKITSEELVRLIEERDINALEAFGGVEAIAISLGTCLKNGIDGHHDDIERRKNQFGENNYPRKPPKKFLMFVWNAFQDTTLAILILCAVLSLILGISTKGIKRGWYDGTSIGLAVALVVIVTACSDYKQSLQFQTLNEVKRNVNIKVIRGGRTLSLSIYELVVGDVAPLNIGDQVPADGLLIHGHSLSIDESSMTGESEQVFKNRMQPFLLSGCKVVDGFGTMIVTCVGLNTEWGKVMSTLTDDFNEETPLQARLRKVATFIGKIGLSVAIVVFLMLFVRYFRTSYSSKMKATEVLSSVVDILSVAVTIVVVAVPEGLPLAVTLTLAYSMRKMMADKSLVRHLAACETMGSATTICSDKTGTLTMNQMSVVRAWVTGNVKNIEDVKELHRSVLLVIFDCIAQNTTGTVFLPKGNGTPEINGSPTEKAILSWGLQIGMDFEVAKSRSSVVHVETFNSTKKRSGLVLELQEEGKHCIYVHWKGAAEIILDVCTKWLDNEGTERTITEEMNLEIKAIINDMAVCSLRCIALAYRQLGENEAPITEGESNACKFPDFGLTLTTILGLKDPCRPGVLEAVQMCQEAGVKVRMVTGDSLLTAEAIARECGILLPDGLIMEGKRFRHLNEQEMVEMLPRIDVLARSSPTDKLLLVRKLKELNEVVGVTGDGTNDAPALREADVGLSMGISGTEVAKESSDVIILDDNFSSVVKVIRWGRSVYANIQKFIQFQLTVNIVALVINFIAAARSTDVPLNTVQLLWVNLIMDTLGALALATEPPSDEQMKKRPVGRSDPLITLVMWRNLVGQALYQLLVLLFLYFNGIKLLRLEGSAAQKKILLNTIVFNAFVFCQIFNEVNCRKPEKFNVIEGLFSNPLFCGVIFVTTVFQVLIVEFLDNFFTTARLHWKFWLICIGIGSMSLPVGALVKLIPVQKTVNWVRWHGWRWQLITGRSFSNCRIPYQGPLPEDEDIVQVDEHTARVESNV